MAFAQADIDLGAEESLRWVARAFDSVVFTTAIDLEGSVIAHMIATAELPIRIVTLDTGLYFPAAYETWRRLEHTLGIRIEAIRSKLDLEAQAEQLGAALWETRPDRCCHVRKIEPLARVLESADAWITGIRRDQTPERAHAPKVGPDERFEVMKVNPLADWPVSRVQDYLRRYDVPYNPMFDEGYPSIGCQPCTRRVQAGESARAGRWSGFAKRECGLHFETADDGTVRLQGGGRS